MKRRDQWWPLLIREAVERTPVTATTNVLNAGFGADQRDRRACVDLFYPGLFNQAHPTAEATGVTDNIVTACGLGPRHLVNDLYDALHWFASMERPDGRPWWPLDWFNAVRLFVLMAPDVLPGFLQAHDGDADRRPAHDDEWQADGRHIALSERMRERVTFFVDGWLDANQWYVFLDPRQTEHYPFARRPSGEIVVEDYPSAVALRW